MVFSEGYFRNGSEIARQSNQIGKTMVAPAKAGFQKLRIAQCAKLPSELKKFCIAPSMLTSGEAGSNSLAMTKNPTNTHSKASLIHPHQDIPSKRRRIWRFSLGSLPVFAAVSPKDSSAGSVTV